MSTIINELTDDTRLIINSLVKKIYKFKGTKFKRRKIAVVPTVTDDDVEYALNIFISSESEFEGYIRDLSNNPKFFDIEMVINPNLVDSKRALYNVLYHEFLHATDPHLTTRQGDEYLKKYDPDSNNKYFSSKIELRAITGEFLEALRNQFKEFLLSDKTPFAKKDLFEILDNVLSFLEDDKKLTEKSRFFIERMEDENAIFISKREMEKIIEKTEKKTNLNHLLEDEKISNVLVVLRLLKINNEGGWKKFIKLVKDEISLLKKT